MLQGIEIEGFRAFSRLRIAPLTRVNLLVGHNNSGKSSVLEAVETLAGGGAPTFLLRGPTRREEGLHLEEDPHDSELELPHVFPGHRLVPGRQLSIVGIGDPVSSAVFEVRLDTGAEQRARQYTLLDDPGEASPPLVLVCAGNRIGEPLRLPIGQSRGALRRDWYRSELTLAEPPTPSVFLGTEGVSRAALGRMWDRIVLTEHEARAVEVLRILVPDVERVAFVGRDRDTGTWTGRRGVSGVIVKTAGSELPVPLGSLGDGVRRLLLTAIALPQATGGYLLLDEVDTSLHYSALLSMWRAVAATARRLDVQVFATTHSGDCVRALGETVAEEPDLAGDFSMHRIEAGSGTAVSYSHDEIEFGVGAHIEMRG